MTFALGFLGCLLIIIGALRESENTMLAGAFILFLFITI